MGVVEGDEGERVPSLRHQHQRHARNDGGKLQMKKYLIAAVLLAANNEVVSWFALCVMGAMLVFDMAGWTTERKW